MGSMPLGSGKSKSLSESMSIADPQAKAGKQEVRETRLNPATTADNPYHIANDP